MAVVSMKRMSLVAHNSDRSRLMRIFIKNGNVEVIKDETLTPNVNDVERRENAEGKRFRVVFALNFLREISREINKADKKAKMKIDLKRENRLVSLEEYEEVGNGDIELFNKIDEMEAINNRLTDIKTERIRIENALEQLRPYEELSLKFSDNHDTEYASMFTGTVPTNKLPNLIGELPEARVFEYKIKDKFAAFSLLVHKDDFEKVNSALAACDFVKANFDFDCTVKERIDGYDAVLSDLEKEKNFLVTRASTYARMIPTLKIAYDFLSLKIAKIDIVTCSKRTQKAIVYEAWVPYDKIDELKKEIQEKCPTAEVFFRDPTDDETPPTLLRNNAFNSAFGGILEMYGMPNYREKDPSLFVALFYFLIFGIMIGDAGYGLIMTVACFLFTMIKKPVKQSGRMIIMFGFCGISTIIWGILFGGWFAITIPSGSFLDKITWFNPFNEPLKMFMLALGVGIIQIGTGFAINGVAEMKREKISLKIKGFLSNFGWVIVFIGLLVLSPKIMVFMGAITEDKPWFADAAKAGGIIALVGACMIVLGGAWGKKNPIKAVGGALGSVYGAINIVSDLLSYSRLFGLGLTTGVIGFVMNNLATTVSEMLGGGFAWIIGAVVLVVGHSFNLGINLLGAYVHDARLQHIEFFGRFYDGTGRAFKPLGGDLKYTFLDN